MGRILAIDFGTKRCGIAATDPLRLIVSPLDTVHPDALLDFLDAYIQNEPVDVIVVGEPITEDGRPARIHHLVVGLVRQLRKRYPELEVATQDERYTSKEAKAIILRSGARKKKRRDKALVDQVSAALILEDYLASQTTD